MRHRQINIIVVKKTLAWRYPVTSLERTLSLILKPIFLLGTNVVSKNLLQVRILGEIHFSLRVTILLFIKWNRVGYKIIVQRFIQGGLSSTTDSGMMSVQVEVEQLNQNLQFFMWRYCCWRHLLQFHYRNLHHATCRSNCFNMKYVI